MNTRPGSFKRALELWDYRAAVAIKPLKEPSYLVKADTIQQGIHPTFHNPIMANPVSFSYARELGSGRQGRVFLLNSPLVGVSQLDCLLSMSLVAN